MLDFNTLKNTLMLPQLINGGIETALNYLLARTANHQPYLRKLDQQVLKLSLQKTDFSCYLLFSTQRIDVLQQYEGNADCEVKLAPSLLLQLPKKSALSQHLNDKSILLDGDLQLLQNFVALMEFLEKDPAELLSRYIGDVPAQSAVNFLRVLSQALRHKLQQSQQIWGERLTEEWQLVSPSLALADFADQVKTLEKQTALLEQKIQQLLGK